jgi:UDP-GlcNAc:undecaprenyl-phosphate GlcNAc-1-phosphate transferase
LILSFALAAGVTLLLTPVAIRLALRTGMLDKPREYRAHSAPTPYLGGAALVAGFFAAALAFGDGAGRYWPLLACGLALCVLGTVDDAVAVPPLRRVAAEFACAGVVTAAGIGWTWPDGALATFALNAVWIAGFTNAFNLMDNMDGAASTVGAVTSAGVALAALIQGDPVLAALALALTAACAGFLPYNLRPGSRARLFLGDGGSMPLGFLAAVITASVPYDTGVGGTGALLIAALLLAVPVLDTLLVTISRSRRGVSLLTGGRDHLTHRVRAAVGSPARVAVVLVVLQSLASTLALGAAAIGPAAVVLTAGLCLIAGLAIVAYLERPEFLVGSGAARAEPPAGAWHPAPPPAAPQFAQPPASEQ